MDCPHHFTHLQCDVLFLKKREKHLPEMNLNMFSKASEAHGVLHPDEAELVWGYLNLQDMLVKELMRPRGEMQCHDLEEPLSKLIYLFAEKKYSRIPVYDNVLDNMLGIISAKQFFCTSMKYNNQVIYGAS